MTHGAPFVEQYRQALMTRSKKLYDSLPADMIWAEGEAKSPLQVSKVTDPRSVFLDLKFPMPVYGLPAPDDPGADPPNPPWNTFPDLLSKFAESEKLPLTKRASFGFVTTNLTKVGSSWRINPGLESDATQLRYTKFLTAVHDAMSAAFAGGKKAGLTGKPLMDHVDVELKKMKVPA
jgi:hypothetical protein